MKLSFHCKIKYYLGSIQIFLQKKTGANQLFITNILVFDSFGYDYQAKYAHFDRNERISYDQTLINKATKRVSLLLAFLHLSFRVVMEWGETISSQLLRE